MSNAIGQTLAIGQSRLAAELRSFQRAIHNEMKECDPDAGDEICRKRFTDFLQGRRDRILRIFEIQLREEAIIRVAMRRYFFGQGFSR